MHVAVSCVAAPAYDVGGVFKLEANGLQYLQYILLQTDLRHVAYPKRRVRAEVLHEHIVCNGRRVFANIYRRVLRHIDIVNVGKLRKRRKLKSYRAETVIVVSVVERVDLIARVCVEFAVCSDISLCLDETKSTLRRRYADERLVEGARRPTRQHSRTELR